MTRKFILFPKAARFTKSYGAGYQVLFPSGPDMPPELERLLDPGPAVRVILNGLSLMSILPAFRQEGGQKIFPKWDNTKLKGYHLSGQEPRLAGLLGMRSFADLEVDVKFFYENSGVLQLSMPTQEQLDAADSTEPKNKPHRRQPQ